MEIKRRRRRNNNNNNNHSLCERNSEELFIDSSEDSDRTRGKRNHHRNALFKGRIQDRHDRDGDQESKGGGGSVVRIVIAH